MPWPWVGADQQLRSRRRRVPPKEKVFHSREVVVEPMKIIIRVGPEQRKDNFKTACGRRKAPGQRRQRPVVQRSLVSAVYVLGDKLMIATEDDAVLANN